eukprot:SAG22_NODE_13680_length_398_cov_0.862876_1_plen_85_part_01
MTKLSAPEARSVGGRLDQQRGSDTWLSSDSESRGATDSNNRRCLSQPCTLADLASHAPGGIWYVISHRCGAAVHLAWQACWPPGS